MKTRKRKQKVQDQPSMMIHTRLGSFIIQFIDATQVKVMSDPDTPVTFFGKQWHLWIDMAGRSKSWKPICRLGSRRANGDIIRRDRMEVSEAAAAKLTALIVAAVNEVCASERFITNLEAADRRVNLKKLAELRAQELHLQSELEVVQMQIQEIERFTI